MATYGNVFTDMLRGRRMAIEDQQKAEMHEQDWMAKAFRNAITADTYDATVASFNALSGTQQLQYNQLARQEEIANINQPAELALAGEGAKRITENAATLAGGAVDTAVGQFALNKAQIDASLKALAPQTTGAQPTTVPAMTPPVQQPPTPATTLPPANTYRVDPTTGQAIWQENGALVTGNVPPAGYTQQVQEAPKNVWGARRPR